MLESEVTYKPKNSARMDYPIVRRDENCCAELHGVEVKDPYRWLEDPDSEETSSFVKAQNDFSRPFLSSSPIHNKFHARKVDCILSRIAC